MIIQGRAMKLGDNIDTDVILPGKYLVLTDPREIAKHALEGLDPSFPDKAKDGVVLVCGHNFGCGSSREHAPLALKYSGVRCIVGKSFARIFYRNSMNVGLAVIECNDAYATVNEGDEMKIDVEQGGIEDVTKDLKFKATPVPEFMIELILEGGLIPYLRKKVASQKN